MGFFTKLRNIVTGAFKGAIGVIVGVVTLDLDLIEESVRTIFRDAIAPILKPVFALLGFEGKTIYSTNVITNRLLEGESTFMKSVVNNSIYYDKDLVEEILIATLNGPKANARRYLEYGESTYIDGLPEVVASSFIIATPSAQLVLEAIEGAPITIVSSALTLPEENDWCKWYLVQNYSFDYATNTAVVSGINWEYDNCTLNPSTLLYTVNLVRTISTTTEVVTHTSIVNVGTEETTTVFDRTTITIDTGTPSELVVTYTDVITSVSVAVSTGSGEVEYIVPYSSVVTYSVETSVLPVEVPQFLLEFYYTIVYYVTSTPTATKLWIYRLEEGTYPSLQTEDVTGATDTMQTLPIITLREEFTSVNADILSERYITSKKILDVLGVIGLDDMIAQIETNPDIATIQDAFILFGAGLYSSDLGTKSYIFNLFQTMSLIPGYDKATFDALSEPDKSKSGFVYAIKEQRYNTTIAFNYAENEYITGSIGAVDTVVFTFDIQPNTEAGTIIIKVPAVPATETEPEIPAVTETSDGLVNSRLIIQYQLNVAQYIEVTIAGLTLATFISTIGDRVNAKIMELVDPTDPLKQAERDNFIIPISYRMLDELPNKEVIQILYAGLHLVIYAELSTDLEYYQTPEFLQFVSIAIKIVALLIVIFSVGTGAPLSAYLLAIGQAILTSVVIGAALNLIIRSGGSDLAKILAFIAVLYAAEQGGTYLFGSVETTTAEAILKGVNAVSMYVSADTSFKLGELVSSQEEEALRQAVTTADDKAKREESGLYDSEGVIDLLNTRSIAVLNTYETPDQFYERAGTTDVADIVLNYADEYVDNNLDIDNIRPFNSGTLA